MAERAEFLLTARDATSRVFGGVRHSLGSLASFAASRFGVIAAGLGAVFGAQAARETIAQAAALERFSRQLRVSGDFLAEMQSITARTGLEFDDFTEGVLTMSEKLAEASAGHGEAVNAFKELGLSARQLTQLSVEDTFIRVADALGKIESPYRRTALAIKIFETEGVKLDRIMAKGAAGIEAMRVEARAMGVETATMRKESARFSEQIRTTGAILKGAFLGGLEVALPAINQQLERMNSNMLEQGGLGQTIGDVWREAAKWARLFGLLLEPTWQIVKSIGRGLREIAAFLGGSISELFAPSQAGFGGRFEALASALSRERDVQSAALSRDRQQTPILLAAIGQGLRNALDSALGLGPGGGEQQTRDKEQIKATKEQTSILERGFITLQRNGSNVAVAG